MFLPLLGALDEDGKKPRRTDRSAYRQTILPQEAILKRKHTKVRDMHSRLLSLAYQRYTGALPDRRQIGALKRNIRSSAIARAEEIIAFIDAGNEMAAVWILDGISRKLAHQRKQALQERLQRRKSKTKINQEPDGKITVLMGRYVRKAGATVLEQRPQTQTLYRWFRILDKIFASLAADHKAMKEFLVTLRHIENHLRFHARAAAAAPLDTGSIERDIAALLISLEGVRVEEKQDCRRELEMALNFIRVQRAKPALACISAGIPSIEVRLGQIAGEIAYLEHLRFQLREISQTRFRRVLTRMTKIRKDISENRFTEAIGTENRAGRRENGEPRPGEARAGLRHVFTWPFLNEPDFMGIRNRILNAQDMVQRIVDRHLKKGLLLGIAPLSKSDEKARQEALDSLDIAIAIINDSLQVSRFMVGYTRLAHQAHMGNVKGFANDEAVFNKVYRDWAARNNFVRGAPTYWHGRCYKTVFLSERSLAFIACDTVLLMIKVKDLRTMIRTLTKHKRERMLAMIYALSNRDISRVTKIPKAERRQFLAELLAAARADYKLDTKVSDKEMEHYYRAFGCEPESLGCFLPGLIFLPLVGLPVVGMVRRSDEGSERRDLGKASRRLCRTGMTASFEDHLQILVVDDSEDVHRHLDRILTAQGYTVVHANGCQEAWQKIEKGIQRIGLVVLDFDMPDGCGVCLLQEMMKAKINIPVVFYTTHQEDVEYWVNDESVLGVTSDVKELQGLIAGLAERRRSQAIKESVDAEVSMQDTDERLFVRGETVALDTEVIDEERLSYAFHHASGFNLRDILRKEKRRYRIESFAGSGLGASVYRAVDLKTGTPVALRVYALSGLSGAIKEFLRNLSHAVAYQSRFPYRYIKEAVLLNMVVGDMLADVAEHEVGAPVVARSRAIFFSVSHRAYGEVVEWIDGGNGFSGQANRKMYEENLRRFRLLAEKAGFNEHLYQIDDRFDGPAQTYKNIMRRHSGEFVWVDRTPAIPIMVFFYPYHAAAILRAFRAGNYRVMFDRLDPAALSDYIGDHMRGEEAERMGARLAFYEELCGIYDASRLDFWGRITGRVSKNFYIKDTMIRYWLASEDISPATAQRLKRHTPLYVLLATLDGIPLVDKISRALIFNTQTWRHVGRLLWPLIKNSYRSRSWGDFKAGTILKINTWLLEDVEKMHDAGKMPRAEYERFHAATKTKEWLTYSLVFFWHTVFKFPGDVIAGALSAYATGDLYRMIFIEHSFHWSAPVRLAIFGCFIPGIFRFVVTLLSAARNRDVVFRWYWVVVSGLPIVGYAAMPLQAMSEMFSNGAALKLIMMKLRATIMGVLDVMPGYRQFDYYVLSRRHSGRKDDGDEVSTDHSVGCFILPGSLMFLFSVPFSLAGIKENDPVLAAMDQEASHRPEGWIYPSRSGEIISVENVPFRVSPEPLYISQQEAALLEHACQALREFFAACLDLVHDRTLLPVDSRWYRYIWSSECHVRLDHKGLLDDANRAGNIFIRPDLVMTENGMGMVELETSFYGLGLVYLLQKIYQESGFEVLGLTGEDFLKSFAQRVLSAGDSGSLQDKKIIFAANERTRKFLGQIQYFTQELQSVGINATAFLLDDTRAPPQTDDGFIRLLRQESGLTVYRCFYVKDRHSNSSVEEIIRLAKEGRITLVPGLSAFCEGKIPLALFHSPEYNPWFEQKLGREHYRILMGLIPKTWVVDNAYIPEELKELGVRQWEEIKNLKRRQRQFVLKPTNQSWGMNLWFLDGESHDKVGRLIRQALGDKETYVIQEALKPRKMPWTYYDAASCAYRTMEGPARLTPYYYLDNGGLFAVKATTRSGSRYIHAASDSISVPVAIMRRDSQSIVKDPGAERLGCFLPGLIFLPLSGMINTSGNRVLPISELVYERVYYAQDPKDIPAIAESVNALPREYGPYLYKVIICALNTLTPFDKDLGTLNVRFLVRELIRLRQQEPGFAQNLIGKLIDATPVNERYLLTSKLDRILEITKGDDFAAFRAGLMAMWRKFSRKPISVEVALRHMKNLSKRSRANRPLYVALTGKTATGKTHIAGLLEQQLDGVVVLHADSRSVTLEEPMLRITGQIEQLQRNSTVRMIVVEGWSALFLEEYTPLVFDVKVLVYADPKTRQENIRLDNPGVRITEVVDELSMPSIGSMLRDYPVFDMVIDNSHWQEQSRGVQPEPGRGAQPEQLELWALIPGLSVFILPVLFMLGRLSGDSRKDPASTKAKAEAGEPRPTRLGEALGRSQARSGEVITEDLSMGAVFDGDPDVQKILPMVWQEVLGKEAGEDFSFGIQQQLWELGFAGKTGNAHELSDFFWTIVNVAFSRSVFPEANYFAMSSSKRAMSASLENLQQHGGGRGALLVRRVKRFGDFGEKYAFQFLLFDAGTGFRDEYGNPIAIRQAVAGLHTNRVKGLNGAALGETYRESYRCVIAEFHRGPDGTTAGSYARKIDDIESEGSVAGEPVVEHGTVILIENILGSYRGKKMDWLPSPALLGYSKALCAILRPEGKIKRVFRLVKRVFRHSQDTNSSNPRPESNEPDGRLLSVAPAAWVWAILGAGALVYLFLCSRHKETLPSICKPSEMVRILLEIIVAAMILSVALAIIFRWNKKNGVNHGSSAVSQKDDEKSSSRFSFLRYRPISGRTLTSLLIAGILTFVGFVRHSSYGSLKCLFEDTALKCLLRQPLNHDNVQYFKILATPSVVSALYLFHMASRNVFNKMGGKKMNNLILELFQDRKRLVVFISSVWCLTEIKKYLSSVLRIETTIPLGPTESQAVNIIVLLASGIIAFWGMKYLSFKPLFNKRGKGTDPAVTPVCPPAVPRHVPLLSGTDQSVKGGHTQDGAGSVPNEISMDAARRYLAWLGQASKIDIRFPIQVLADTQVSEHMTPGEIMGILRERNMYCRSMDEEKLQGVVARIVYLQTHIAPLIVRYWQQRYPGENIVSVSVYGSWPYNDNPSDLDIDIIVEGDAYALRSIDREYLEKHFSSLDIPVKDISFVVFGLENIEQGKGQGTEIEGGRVHTNVLETTTALLYVRNIPAFGRDFIPLENYRQHLNAIAADFLKAALQRIKKIDLKNEESDGKRMRKVIARLHSASVLLEMVDGRARGYSRTLLNLRNTPEQEAISESQVTSLWLKMFALLRQRVSQQDMYSGGTNPANSYQENDQPGGGLLSVVPLVWALAILGAGASVYLFLSRRYKEILPLIYKHGEELHKNGFISDYYWKSRKAMKEEMRLLFIMAGIILGVFLTELPDAKSCISNPLVFMITISVAAPLSLTGLHFIGHIVPAIIFNGWNKLKKIKYATDIQRIIILLVPAFIHAMVAVPGWVIASKNRENDVVFTAGFAFFAFHFIALSYCLLRSDGPAIKTILDERKNKESRRSGKRYPCPKNDQPDGRLLSVVPLVWALAILGAGALAYLFLQRQHKKVLPPIRNFIVSRAPPLATFKLLRYRVQSRVPRISTGSVGRRFQDETFNLAVAGGKRFAPSDEISSRLRRDGLVVWIHAAAASVLNNSRKPGTVSTLLRRVIAGIFIVLMSSVISVVPAWSAPQETASQQTQRSIPTKQAAYAKIRELAQAFEYSPQIANELVALAPALDIPRLLETQDEMERLELLVAAIRNSFSPHEDSSLGWDLSEVLRLRKSNCLGYVQLFYIYGRAVGLHINPIYVFTSNEFNMEHAATMADIGLLSYIVDLSVTESAYISPGFNFHSVYRNPQGYLGSLEMLFPGGKDGGLIFKLQSDELPSFYTTIRQGNAESIVSWIYTNRGDTYFRNGDLEQALLTFTRALEINPYYEIAWSGLGIVYLRMGELEAAEECFRTALAKNPEYARPHYDLGLMLENAGDYEGACAHFLKVLELRPDDTAAMNWAGVCYLERGMYDEARPYLLNAIAIDPDPMYPYFHLGRISFAQDKPEEALAYFYLAQERDAGVIDELPLELQGPLSAAMDTTGVNTLQKQIESMAYGILGREYGFAKNDELALGYFAASIEVDPENAGAFFELGLFYLERGEYDRAIENYLEAIRLLPEPWEAYFDIGRAYFSQDKKEEAFVYFYIAYQKNNQVFDVLTPEFQGKIRALRDDPVAQAQLLERRAQLEEGLRAFALPGFFETALFLSSLLGLLLASVPMAGMVKEGDAIRPPGNRGVRMDLVLNRLLAGGWGLWGNMTQEDFQREVNEEFHSGYEPCPELQSIFGAPKKTRVQFYQRKESPTAGPLHFIWAGDDYSSVKIYLSSQELVDRLIKTFRNHAKEALELIVFHERKEKKLGSHMQAWVLTLKENLSMALALEELFDQIQSQDDFIDTRIELIPSRDERQQREALVEMIMSILSGYFKERAVVINHGSVGRETDMAGRFDIDMTVQFADDFDRDEENARLKIYLDTALARQGYFIDHVKGYLPAHGKQMFTFLLKDRQGIPVTRVEISMSESMKTYPEMFNAQIAQIRENFGEKGLQEVLSDILVMKYILQKIVNSYKKVHGGLRGIGAEQLIIQSGGFDESGWQVKTPGSLYKAMALIYFYGYNTTGRRIRPLSEVREKFKICDLEGSNCLDTLNEWSWRRLVHAAKIYVEGKRFNQSFAHPDELAYALKDAFDYNQKAVRVCELRGPRDIHQILAQGQGYDFERIGRDGYYVYFYTEESFSRFEQSGLLQFITAVLSDDDREKPVPLIESTSGYVMRDGIMDRRKIKEEALKRARKIKLNKKDDDHEVIKELGNIYVYVDERIFEFFKMKQSDIEYAIQGGSNDCLNIDHQGVFYRGLREREKKCGSIVIALADESGLFIMPGGSDGLVIVPPQIKEFDPKDALRLMSKLIANQLFDMAGRYYEEDGRTFELESVEDLIIPFHDSDSAGSILPKYFTLKRILGARHPITVKMDERINKGFYPGKDRTGSSRVKEEFPERVAKLRKAYVLASGTKSDIEQAYGILIEVLNEFIDARETWSRSLWLDYWSRPAMYVLFAYAKEFPERAVLNHFSRWLDWHHSCMYPEEKAGHLKKEWNYKLLQFSLKIGQSMTDEELLTVLEYMLDSNKFYHIEEAHFTLLDVLARQNRGQLIDILFSMLLSKQLTRNWINRGDSTKNIEAALGHLLTEDDFERLVELHENAEEILKQRRMAAKAEAKNKKSDPSKQKGEIGEENEGQDEDLDEKLDENRDEDLDEKPGEGEGVYGYKSGLRGIMVLIGGKKALAFLSQGLDNPITEYGVFRTEYEHDLEALLKREIMQGNLELIEFIRRRITTPLTAHIERLAAKKEAGDCKEGERPGRDDDLIKAAMAHMATYLWLTVDVDLYKKLSSLDEEGCLDNGHDKERFAGIQNKEVRRFYALRLAKMIEVATTDKALKNVLFAFCSLHGESPESDEQGLWFKTNDDWIDYESYGKTLRVLGDLMAELAEESRDRKEREELFVVALKMHSKALDNFYYRIPSQVSDAIKDLRQYRGFVIRKANQGDMRAIRVLLTDRSFMKELVGEGRLILNAEALARAFLDHHFNRILSSYSDMVKLFEKRVTGHRLVPLSEKLEGLHMEELTEPLLVGELKEYLEEFDLEISQEKLEAILDDMNLALHGEDEIIAPHLSILSNGFIVPRFSVLDTGYRGTRENDHSDARYTTRAVTTAIMHYGWRGGEAADRDRNGVNQVAQGRTVIQEIDYQLSPTATKKDIHVSLALAFEEPIPSYAYKRRVFLNTKTVTAIVKELMYVQRIEYEAKRAILAAADEIESLDSAGTPEMIRLILEIEVALQTLHYQTGAAGLLEGYYNYVYTPLIDFVNERNSLGLEEIKKRLRENRTLQILRNEYSYRFNFPCDRHARVMDCEASEVVNMLERRFREDEDYIEAMTYVHRLSTRTKARVARSDEFLKFFKRLVKGGTKKDSKIRLVEAVDILKGCGLLSFVIHELSPLHREESDSFFHRRVNVFSKLDLAMTTVFRFTEDIKHGRVKEEDGYLLFFASICSIIPSLSGQIRWRSGNKILPNMKFSEQETDMLKAIVLLTDEQHLRGDEDRDGFAEKVQEVRKEFRRLTRAQLQRAVTIAIPVIFKKMHARITRMSGFVGDPDFCIIADFESEDVIRWADEYDSRNVTLLKRLSDLYTALDKQYEKYRYNVPKGKEKEHEATAKRMETIRHRLRIASSPSFLRKQLKEYERKIAIKMQQIEEADEEFRRLRNGVNSNDPDDEERERRKEELGSTRERLREEVRALEFQKHAVEETERLVQIYSSERSGLKKRKSDAIRALRLADFLDFVVAFFGAVNQGGSKSVKKHKIEEKKGRYSRVNVVAPGAGYSIDDGWTSEWKGKTLYYVGSNILLRIGTSFRDNSIILSENLGSDIVVAVRGEWEEEDYAQDLVIQRIRAGQERQDFDGVVEKLKDFKIEKARIAVFVNKDQDNQDFISYVRALFPSAVIQEKGSDSAIAVSYQEARLINAQTFHNFKLRKGNMEQRIYWDDVKKHGEDVQEAEATDSEASSNDDDEDDLYGFLLPFALGPLMLLPVAGMMRGRGSFFEGDIFSYSPQQRGIAERKREVLAALKDLNGPFFATAKAIVDQLPIREGDMVMSIGSGDNLFVEIELASRGVRVIAFDPVFSPQALSYYCKEIMDAAFSTLEAKSPGNKDNLQLIPFGFEDSQIPENIVRGFIISMGYSVNFFSAIAPDCVFGKMANKIAQSFGKQGFLLGDEIDFPLNVLAMNGFELGEMKKAATWPGIFISREYSFMMVQRPKDQEAQLKDQNLGCFVPSALGPASAIFMAFVEAGPLMFLPIVMVGMVKGSPKDEAIARARRIMARPVKPGCYLSRSEERILIWAFQLGDNNLRGRICDYIVKNNIGFVGEMFNRHGSDLLRAGISRVEMKAIGRLALLGALGKFDLSFENGLLTYWEWWMKGEISQYRNKIHYNGKSKAEKETAVVSLDAKRGSNDDREEGECIPQRTFEDAEERLDREQEVNGKIKLARRHIASLEDPRRRLIVGLRHGIGTKDGQPWSQERVGNLWGISKQAISITEVAIKATLNGMDQAFGPETKLYADPFDDSDVALAEMVEENPKDELLRLQFSRRMAFFRIRDAGDIDEALDEGTALRAPIQKALARLDCRLRTKEWWNLPVGQKLCCLDEIVEYYKLGPLEWIILSKLLDGYGRLYNVRRDIERLSDFVVPGCRRRSLVRTKEELRQRLEKGLRNTNAAMKNEGSAGVNLAARIYTLGRQLRFTLLAGRLDLYPDRDSVIYQLAVRKEALGREANYPQGLQNGPFPDDALYKHAMDIERKEKIRLLPRQDESSDEDSIVERLKERLREGRSISRRSFGHHTDSQERITAIEQRTGKALLLDARSSSPATREYQILFAQYLWIYYSKGEPAHNKPRALKELVILISFMPIEKTLSIARVFLNHLLLGEAIDNFRDTDAGSQLLNQLIRQWNALPRHARAMLCGQGSRQEDALKVVLDCVLIVPDGARVVMDMIRGDQVLNARFEEVISTEKFKPLRRALVKAGVLFQEEGLPDKENPDSELSPQEAECG